MTEEQVKQAYLIWKAWLDQQDVLAFAHAMKSAPDPLATVGLLLMLSEFISSAYQQLNAPVTELSKTASFMIDNLEALQILGLTYALGVMKGETEQHG